MRTVDYTADSVHGFNAVVSKIGPNVHVPPQAVNTVPLGAPLPVPSHVPGPIPENKPIIQYSRNPVPVPVEVPNFYTHQIYPYPGPYCK